MQFDLLYILVMLGSLQGFLLALVFVLNKKFRNKANMHLALLIFVLSLVNLVNALEESHTGGMYAFLDYLPLHWVFLIPFSLYYYIQYLVDPRYEFHPAEYLLLIPFFLQLFYQILVFFLYLGQSEGLEDKADLIAICNSYFEIGAIISTLTALILGIRKLNEHEEGLFEKYSNIESQSLEWLKYTLYASLGLWLLWALPFAMGVRSKTYYVPLYLGQGFISYWIGYFMYAKSDLFELEESLLEDETKDQIEQNLPSKIDEHYQNLLSILEGERLFKNPDLSMSLLAAKMNLSNGYLSQIINQKEKKNFFDFINGYRVEEVKKNLANPAYGHFSILGIGLEAGFKSKSTFNAVFKKMTGYTPSSYKKLLKNPELKSE